MKKVLLAPLVLLLLASCSKIGVIFNEFTSEKKITSFALLYGNDTIKMNILDSTIEGLKPDTGSKASLVVLFSFKGKKVRVDQTSQISGVTANDFTKTVSYIVEAEDGSIKIYKVKLRSFTGLPILYITSPPILSKDVYVDGSILLDANHNYGVQGGDISNYKAQFKGRGNSTWGLPKKPYKIKLNDKSGILGMPADKEWALLASYFDKSLLRNDLYLELSERMGMVWTPKRRLVEVFLNGEYNGNYVLTETVKTGKDRLNIKLMDTKDLADTTGGFLVEANARLDELQNFIAIPDVPFSVKEPEVLNPVQLAHVRRELDALATDLYLPADVRAKIDLDSWIKWMIVNEITRNMDAIMFGSVNVYRSEGKIFFGPVWDADMSSGAYLGSEVQGWYINVAHWFGPLFLYHPYYRERFKTLWNANRTNIMSMPKYVSSQAALIDLSQTRNYEKWDVLDKPTFEGQIVNKTYADEITYLNEWLTKRIQWIDKEINK